MNESGNVAMVFVIIRRSFAPDLRGEGEGVEFGPGFLPGRVVFGHEGHEPFAMPWLQEVDHLVDDDVLQEVLGLLD